jgi:hypothetical protein
VFFKPSSFKDLPKGKFEKMAQGFKPSKAGSSSKGKTTSSTRTKTGPKRGREYYSLARYYFALTDLLPLLKNS